MIRRSMLKTRAQGGQTIYQTMLAISCVMLVLAIFFPVFEYFWLYRGPAKPDMFREGAVSSSVRPSTPPAATEGEGASEAPAPAEGATPGETEAPAPAAGEGEAEN